MHTPGLVFSIMFHKTGDKCRKHKLKCVFVCVCVYLQLDFALTVTCKMIHNV